MKVIFYYANPFFLAHGGTQTLIESLMREIAALGAEVQPARWWDDKQSGDVLHFISRPTSTLVLGAKQKGFKTVMTENLDQTSSRSPLALWFRKAAFQLDRICGGRLAWRLGTDVYQLLDAMVYCVELARQ